MNMEMPEIETITEDNLHGVIVPDEKHIWITGNFGTIFHSNDRGESWRIAIERPDPAGRTLHLVVPLSGLALATSGDYRNYYEIEGRRISHTIDPRTGYPITHRFTSASVVTGECVQADAWATALLVLGPEGVALAEELGLAAFFLERNPEGGFTEHRTTAFDSLLDGT